MGTITARAERTMSVPVDLLVDAVLALDEWDQWLEIHGGWPDGVPPTPETGHRFRQRVVIHGVGDDVTWTVRESRLPTRIALEGQGSYGSTIALGFSVVGETDPLLTCEVQVRGPWPAPAPLKRVAVRTMEAEFERVLDKIELHVRRTRLGHSLSGAELDRLACSPPPPKLFSAGKRLLGIEA